MKKADGEDSRESDSIFSQLLNRIMQGHRLRLGEGVEGCASFDILIENCPDPVLVLAEDGTIMDANPAFCAAYGYLQGELLQRPVMGLLPSHQEFEKRFAGFVAQGDGERAVKPDDIIAFNALKADGTIVPMDCLLSSLHDGERRRILAIIRDLSVDRRLIEQLKESTDHYLALSETITEAIIRIDDDFTILFANSGIKNTFGYEPAEIVGENLRRLFPEEVFDKHEPEFRKYFFIDDQDRSAIGLKRTIELLGRTKSRGISPMEMSFGNSKDFKGRTLTCIIRDITQRKTMERRLRYLAFHDKLTGLGNRDLFNEELHAVLEKEVKERGGKAALLFLDLDGFKNINDTLGHSAGDEFLIETARRIRVSLRVCDSAYRFGGDEFVVLLPEIKHAKDSVPIADRILRAVHEPCKLHSDTGSANIVSVGVSIGVAVIPDHGESIEAATRSADTAMYYSKESGKNRFTVFSESLRTKSSTNWRLEQNMRAALVRGDFALHYQPIVDIEGRVCGLEALVRWMHAGGSFTPPDEFIPAAEENGMIIPLGAWIFRRAFADLKRLHANGFNRLYLSINVSEKQLEQRDFVESLSEAIEHAGVDHTRISLELTETTLMQKPDVAVAKILAIKKRFPAIMLAIDDFGTGYSSLSYLSRLPVDSLKIDQSFVAALEHRQNRTVVNAILNLSSSMGLKVVAEGIETTEQRDYFRSRHCNNMQGFLFGKAVPIDVLMKSFNAIRRKKGLQRGGDA